MGNVRIISFFLLAVVISLCGSSGIEHDHPPSQINYERQLYESHNYGRHVQNGKSATTTTTDPTLCKLEAIEKLRTVKIQVLQDHTNYSIARTFGSTISILGGISSLIGILLVSSATTPLSTGLTATGLVFYVLGSGVTVTTNILETAKSDEWIEEMEMILQECDIPPRLVEDNHSKLMHFAMMPLREAPYILIKGQTALTIGKILKLMVASAKDFQQMEVLTAQVPVQNKYFYASVLPGTFIWNTNHWLTRVVSKIGINTAKVGVPFLQMLSLGVGVVGVGMDIYAISETWGKVPDISENIDKIMRHLESESQSRGSNKNNRGTSSDSDDIMVTIYRSSHDSSSGEDNFSVIDIAEEQCFTWSGNDSWNDQVTRFTLHGKCVRAWTGENCTGSSSCFCESQNDLFGRWITPRKNWNDEISSFSSCNYGGNITTVAKLYEYQNFTGSRTEIQLRDKECVSFFHADGWNDRVSSLNVTRGCVEYFNEALCKGKMNTVRGAEHRLRDDYDNKISSFRPCTNATAITGNNQTNANANPTLLGLTQEVWRPVIIRQNFRDNSG